MSPETDPIASSLEMIRDAGGALMGICGKQLDVIPAPSGRMPAADRLRIDIIRYYDLYVRLEAEFTDLKDRDIAYWTIALAVAEVAAGLGSAHHLICLGDIVQASGRHADACAAAQRALHTASTIKTPVAQVD